MRRLEILFFCVDEVKQMAKRVASGQLELISTNPTSECTSESETESIEEAFQHVAIRVQRSRDQQRERWRAGDNVEPWDVGCEDRSASEESDLESMFISSGGKAEKRIISSPFLSLSISQQISSPVILLK